MSAESLERIHARFAAQVEQACIEGRGADHLDEFIEQIAVDFASTVFLVMETEVAKVSPDATDGLWQWAQEFPYRCGLGLIEGVSTSLATFNASKEQISAAEMVAAQAYQERLDGLFGNVGAGGSA